MKRSKNKCNRAYKISRLISEISAQITFNMKVIRSRPEDFKKGSGPEYVLSIGNFPFMFNHAVFGCIRVFFHRTYVEWQTVKPILKADDRLTVGNYSPINTALKIVTVLPMIADKAARTQLPW